MRYVGVFLAVLLLLVTIPFIDLSRNDAVPATDDVRATGTNWAIYAEDQWNDKILEDPCFRVREGLSIPDSGKGRRASSCPKARGCRKRNGRRTSDSRDTRTSTSNNPQRPPVLPRWQPPSLRRRRAHVMR